MLRLLGRIKKEQGVLGLELRTGAEVGKLDMLMACVDADQLMVFLVLVLDLSWGDMMVWIEAGAIVGRLKVCLIPLADVV